MNRYMILQFRYKPVLSIALASIILDQPVVCGYVNNGDVVLANWHLRFHPECYNPDVQNIHNIEPMSDADLEWLYRLALGPN